MAGSIYRERSLRDPQHDGQRGGVAALQGERRLGRRNLSLRWILAPRSPTGAEKLVTAVDFPAFRGPAGRLQHTSGWQTRAHIHFQVAYRIRKLERFEQRPQNWLRGRCITERNLRRTDIRKDHPAVEGSGGRRWRWRSLTPPCNARVRHYSLIWKTRVTGVAAA